MRVFAVIDESGHLYFGEPREGKDDLEFLQTAVGGFIESPSILADGLTHLTMWCNEEGKLNGACRPNPVATRFVGYAGLDMVYGNVVISGPTGPEGETTGLERDQMLAVGKAWYEAVREQSAVR